MDDPDRSWALPVVAVLLVVLAAAGAWGYQSLLLTVGEPPVETVQAGAAVECDATAGTVTVAFASNQNADHLLVTLAENESALRVANTSTDATVTDEGVRLPAVGDRVIYEQRRSAGNATVEVVVVAVEGDVRTVIVAKDVEL